MIPSLIDIGLNLTNRSFDRDRREVVERALQQGVRRMILTGSTVAESRKAWNLCGQWPGVLHSTAGIHPHHASERESDSMDGLREIASESPVVAIGECGLDYFRMLSPRKDQRASFEAQLDLAIELDMPVFLHQREAHEDFVAMLRPCMDRLPDAVVHCFTEGPRELEEYLEMGCHIGVTGWVCDGRRSEALRASVPLIPGERLMLETDAPYLLPRDLGLSVRRNEPCHLPHIAQAVATLRDVPLEELARTTTATAIRFFRLPSAE